MNDLLDEAKRMPDAAIRFAQGISWVKTPEHLVPLRDLIRSKHRGDLAVLHGALSDRFQTAADYINVFYAASEMALMERVGRNELLSTDRRALRQLWESLLRAS